MSTGIVQSFTDRQTWLDGLSDAIQPLIGSAFTSTGEAGRVVKDLLNGVWLGHPLHPVLTDVPIGAWTMSQMFDLLGMMAGDDNLDMAADVTLTAGILAALASALTGLTDWSDIDSYNTSRRRMGLAHGLLNVAGVTLNLGSLGLRLTGKRTRGLARMLSACGYMTSALAAYVGGELVYNLGTAVSRNSFVSGPTKFTNLVPVADIPEGTMKKFDVKGYPIVVLKHEDGIHAFGGTCSHLGCDLWKGNLEGHVVTCECHGSQFDITDGSVIHGPATAPVPSYDLQQQEGMLQVKLMDLPPAQ